MWRHLGHLGGAAVLLAIGTYAAGLSIARAQQLAGGANALPAADSVPGDSTPTQNKADGADAADKSSDKSSGLGQRRERAVGPGEQLSFREQEVAAEMSELEQRMFRLSEVLKKLEPENSSRLMLGLKYAREELILHQMQDVQEALGKLSLKNALDEQRQLLAKLERLQQLLLSTDLDFEMRLERLRQIREVLRKLDGVIKEESREEKLSKQAAEKEKAAGGVGQAAGGARSPRQTADGPCRTEYSAGERDFARRGAAHRDHETRRSPRGNAQADPGPGR